ncbi:MAG TPA: hypothetical protein DDZ80_06420 [Cyanobacteria bacterium UBA8803]|nr:hypothetical protein [Cyanobacteria bacterium UBA9273]HBL58165.1 hypothetical protein [Cyanobacteria bacterium UBA8803]
MKSLARESPSKTCQLFAEGWFPCELNNKLAVNQRENLPIGIGNIVKHSVGIFVRIRSKILSLCSAYLTVGGNMAESSGLITPETKRTSERSALTVQS